MGRQARLKRERSEARRGPQPQSPQAVKQWQDLPAPSGSGREVYVQGTLYTDTPTDAGAVRLPSHALAHTTDNHGITANAPTLRDRSHTAPTDDTRRAQAKQERAKVERAHHESGNTTITHYQPKPREPRPDPRAALASLFAHGLMIMADAPCRTPHPAASNQPLRRDGRFSPKRPR